MLYVIKVKISAISFSLTHISHYADKVGVSVPSHPYDRIRMLLSRYLQRAVRSPSNFASSLVYLHCFFCPSASPALTSVLAPCQVWSWGRWASRFLASRWRSCSGPRITGANASPGARPAPPRAARPTCELPVSARWAAWGRGGGEEKCNPCRSREMFCFQPLGVCILCCYWCVLKPRPSEIFTRVLVYSLFKSLISFFSYVWHQNHYLLSAAVLCSNRSAWS